MKSKIAALTAFALISTCLLHAQLRINNGALLYNNGATLTLNDLNLDNSGTLDGSTNSVIFFAGAIDRVIKADGQTTLYNVTINKKAGSKILLANSIKVKGAITFQNGMLDLGNNNLELVYPSGMLVNESEKSRIVTGGQGEVFITQNLSNPLAANPGNLGAVITSSQNIGLTTIRRGHKTDSINGQISIARYHKIVPANNVNLNATLKLYYLDAELGSLAESSLTMFNKPAGTWMMTGKGASDETINFIEKNNIVSFDMYTLSSSDRITTKIGGTPVSSNRYDSENTVLPKHVYEKSIITVGPNPTTGSLNIGLNLTEQEKVTVLVVDMKGVVVMQKHWQAAQGSSVETMHLDNLARGVYLIQFAYSTGAKQSFKIVKQ